MTSLIDVVTNDNIRILELLVAVPGSVSERDLQHALVQAVKCGHTRCVQILLNAGSNPDAADSSGTTPLHLAAEAGLVDVITTLTAAGCDVDADISGRGTPLHKAAQWGKDDSVAVLIKAGARLNTRDREKNTPLILAAKNCRRGVKTMANLCEAGCNANLTDSESRTALHYCCHKGIGVETLLKSGADPNIQDVDGNTPMHLASIEGLDAVVRSLLKYNASADLPNCFKKLPIHYLAMKNHWMAIEDIAHAYGNVDVPDESGNLPLWYAVSHNRVAAVKALLEANCQTEPISSTDGNSCGGNPLRTALERGYYGVCKLLILAGCDLLPLYDWVRKAEEEMVNRQAESQEPLRIFDAPPQDEEDESDSNSEEEEVKEETWESALEWFEDWLHCPHTLKQLCRIYIRNHMGHDIRHKHQELPLPASLADYVALKEVHDHHIPGFGFTMQLTHL